MSDPADMSDKSQLAAESPRAFASSKSSNRGRSSWLITRLRNVQTISAWFATALLVLLPIALLTDFGGVLHWTQYLAFQAVLLIVSVTAVSMLGEQRSSNLRQHVLLIPLVGWVIYGYVQTVSFPASFVEAFSPASHAAYTQWIAPLIPAASLPSQFPISVDPHSSRHSLAIMMMVIAVGWSSATIFHTRQRTIFMLSAVSLSGAALALFGIARMTFPHATFFDFTETDAGIPFGTFVNRNNAAL
ncbi:hypothetical protein N9N28_14370, partial [Rubripirellula amarantea]|nr:hypothetical protein [Rubripirellula amarantea]